MKCSIHEHLSRRALLKGAAATGAGAAVMNWGGLVHSADHAQTAAKGHKRCILLWMNGGASQFETFDMKPQSRYGGLFRPISTKVTGTQVCELMPTIAQKMDQLCVIRSMRTSQIDHPGGIYLMHTGYQPAANVRFPEIGAVAAKYLGREQADLPSFVKIASNGNAGGGLLGAKYQPFSLNHDGRLPAFAKSNLDVERGNAAARVASVRRRRLRAAAQGGDHPHASRSVRGFPAAAARVVCV